MERKKITNVCDRRREDRGVRGTATVCFKYTAPRSSRERMKIWSDGERNP
jgi:hypothetical protein